MFKKNFNCIPAIDLIGGKVVRLSQGDYDQVDYYSDSPVQWAKKFEKAGAKRIHLIDLEGAKDGKPLQMDTIRQIRSAVDCELELGGGIRNEETLKSYLNIGVNYLILGSLLVKDQALSLQWIDRYPNQLICGIDARNQQVSIDGWKTDSQLHVFDLFNHLNGHPIHAIIYTDIATDGMLKGPNLSELKTVSEKSPFPVIASGGVSSKQDIQSLMNLVESGVVGCIIGKAIYTGHIQLNEMF